MLPSRPVFSDNIVARKFRILTSHRDFSIWERIFFGVCNLSFVLFGFQTLALEKVRPAWGQPAAMTFLQEENWAQKPKQTFFMGLLRSDFWKWTPHPKWSAEVAKCGEDSAQLPAAAKNCIEGQKLGTDFLGNAWSAWRSLSIQFNADQPKWPQWSPSSLWTPVEFSFAGPEGQSVRLRGIWGQKKGFAGANSVNFANAPIVVLRAGIFSQASEFLPERFLWIQYFEQLPVHLLFLESTTGAEFLLRNQNLFQQKWVESLFSVQAEADLTVEVARLLQKQFPKSSVHLLGVSWGGQAAAEIAAREVSPFSSVTLLCPVLDRQATLAAHAKKTGFLQLGNWWLKKRFLEVHPELQDLFKMPGNPMSEIAQLLRGDVLVDVADSGASSARVLQRPTLLLASRFDPLVPSELNAEKWFAGRDPKLSGFLLESGWHCSFPGSYQWNSILPVMELHILNSAKLAKAYSAGVRVPGAMNHSSGAVRLSASGEVSIQTADFGSKQVVLPGVALPFPLETSEGRLANERWLSYQLQKTEGEWSWPTGLKPLR